MRTRARPTPFGPAGSSVDDLLAVILECRHQPLGEPFGLLHAAGVVVARGDYLIASRLALHHVRQRLLVFRRGVLVLLALEEHFGHPLVGFGEGGLSTESSLKSLAGLGKLLLPE